MLNVITDVLTREELETINQLLTEDGEFVDGKKTAGYRAERVKNNLQLNKTPKQAKQLNPLIINALERNEIFQRVALPKRIHRPLFSRYHVGMNYGSHVDDALMDLPNVLRTDLAVTVFLNEPARYDGGELAIETSSGEHMVKLAGGDAVVYPASSLHRVTPVTRGERLAAVTWIQSYVRERERREILVDLDKLRHALHERMSDAPETNLAYKTYSNLLRMWADV